MKCIIAILTSLLYSCSNHPIETDAKINKTNISTRDGVIITVSARNISRKTITTATINSLGTPKGISSNEIMFEPDARYYSDFAVMRDYPSVNYIPTTESFKPNETKSYTFYWYPTKLERGSGDLSIFLPTYFQPVDPFNITIKSTQ
jgi:hypothetical protein